MPDPVKTIKNLPYPLFYTIFVINISECLPHGKENHSEIPFGTCVLYPDRDFMSFDGLPPFASAE
jgi:hypothetical protein